MSLNETVRQIETREDFVAMLAELLLDLRTKPEEWENSTLERYLEAIADWTGDSDGYYANRGIPVPEQPNWRTFGEVLLAAKYYE